VTTPADPPRDPAEHHTGDVLGQLQGGRGVFDPALLDRCISCGFCLPACPTYALTGDEKSSPRGRITLMRALETGALGPDDPTLQAEASFCLGCRACEPVCPAGVQYGALLEQWRDHQWRGRRRPLLARLLTLAVARRAAVRSLGIPGRLRDVAARRRAPGGQPAVHLMLGCFERALFPAVSRAARRLRPELAAPGRQGCCGALHAHNGDLHGGEELARRLGRDLPGLIVTTSGGCAAHLAAVIGRDRVQEVSEYLLRTASPGAAHEVRVAGRRARVALQDSCHLRNGLGVAAEPRELLRRVADYVELPSAATCCGAAGTYALLRPADSRRVLAPKLAEIAAADVDYVVAVNPGCLRQLRTGLARERSAVRALHLVEFLALARPVAD
jgi:glycolate oxidase iron-sulfur subunit